MLGKSTCGRIPVREREVKDSHLDKKKRNSDHTFAAFNRKCDLQDQKDGVSTKCNSNVPGHMQSNVAHERPSKRAKPACEGPSRWAGYAPIRTNVRGRRLASASSSFGMRGSR